MKNNFITYICLAKLKNNANIWVIGCEIFHNNKTNIKLTGLIVRFYKHFKINIYTLTTNNY